MLKDSGKDGVTYEEINLSKFEMVLQENNWILQNVSITGSKNTVF